MHATTSQSREENNVVPGERSGRPLGSYGVLMSMFVAIFGGAIATAAARGKLPNRLPAYDLVLAGVAGHKLSRLIVADQVTAPLRAPFVEFHENDQGELDEQPRGAGMRRAMGELVTCPSCVGQWTTAAFVTGLVLVPPRVTRAVGSIFVADAISDFLHVAYRASKERA